MLPLLGNSSHPCWHFRRIFSSRVLWLFELVAELGGLGGFIPLLLTYLFSVGSLLLSPDPFQWDVCSTCLFFMCGGTSLMSQNIYPEKHHEKVCYHSLGVGGKKLLHLGKMAFYMMEAPTSFSVMFKGYTVYIDSKPWCKKCTRMFQQLTGLKSPSTWRTNPIDRCLIYPEMIEYYVQSQSKT